MARRPARLLISLSRSDDATGAIYSAFLVEEEGTASTFFPGARGRFSPSTACR